MPEMGTTGIAQRANSLQESLSTSVEYEAARMQVWGQFPFVPEGGVVGGEDAAQTAVFRFQPRLNLRTGTIDNLADIEAEQVTDNRVSVTINTYGHAVQSSEFAELVTKGNLRQEMSEVIAENMVASLDRLAGRNYYEGNNLVYRANGVATRADLDSTNDILSNSTVGMSFLARATAQLRAAKAPGFDGESGGQQSYMSVIHTALAQDLPETNGYLSALQNREGRDTLFNGEMGEIRGLRFSESNQGKVYPGAGAPAQAATTLSTAVSKGDTTITVASATGLSVGDIITIGTVENGVGVLTEPEDVENVMIIGVNSTILTIAGLGLEGTDDTSTPALKYDHPAGTSVIEAALVAAIPIFGTRSVMKAHGGITGPFGQAVVSGPFDVLQRFVNIGWKAYVGWAQTRGLWIVRMEVATKFPAIVVNE